MIDIHVHLFPDDIAAQVVGKLAADAGGIPVYGNGTARSLSDHMQENGVRYCVNQPVATNPVQVKGINRRVAEIVRRGTPLLSFGSVHPDQPDAVEEIHRLKESGIKGIKLHPDYQQFHPDDDRLLPLYEACRACGMVVFFHAGMDLAYPYTHGTPLRFARVLDIRGLRVVLAHMGGYRMWDDVEKHLLGKEVYIETSFAHEIEPGRFSAMLRAHGGDRVLFGSDNPWGHAGHLRKYIQSLGLAQELQEKIFYKNSAQLLAL